MTSDAAALVQELRTRGIGERVLDAIAATPRELFADAEHRGQAYENRPLPIGCEQTISQPYVVARMCELLELRGDERVLDVGTGSGWHAAVLGRLAAGVVSVERHAALTQRARRALRAAGVANVALVTGDGTRGHAAAAPYGAINVAAAAEGALPAALGDQLADGGRLVAPLDDRLVVVRRDGEQFTQVAGEGVRFVPLVGGLPITDPRHRR